MDVFALVKGYMSDTELSQPALNVYPEAFKDATGQFWSSVNLTNDIVQQKLEDARRQEILELARYLEQDFPHLDRTVRYYRSIADPARPRKPYPKLSFIAAGPAASSRIGDVKMGECPPPLCNHPLQVVFHHSRR